jgi:hypothetical protein
MAGEAGRTPDQISGDSLETLKLQHYFIIAGFALLILTSLGHSRSRRKAAPGAGWFSWWLRYGDFIALGMVAAGLVGLMLQK